jgi:hypothetical protein
VAVWDGERRGSRPRRQCGPAAVPRPETPTPWVALDLRYVAPRWVMTLKDGTVYEFDVNWGLLQRIQDHSGN